LQGSQIARKTAKSGKTLASYLATVANDNNFVGSNRKGNAIVIMLLYSPVMGFNMPYWIGMEWVHGEFDRLR